MKNWIVLQPTESGAIICHIRAKAAFAEQIAAKYSGSYIKDIVAEDLAPDEFRAFMSYCAFGTKSPNDTDGAMRAAKQVIAQLRANAIQEKQ